MAAWSLLALSSAVLPWPRPGKVGRRGMGGLLVGASVECDHLGLDAKRAHAHRGVSGVCLVVGNFSFPTISDAFR